MSKVCTGTNHKTTHDEPQYPGVATRVAAQKQVVDPRWNNLRAVFGHKAIEKFAQRKGFIRFIYNPYDNSPGADWVIFAELQDEKEKKFLTAVSRTSPEKAKSFGLEKLNPNDYPL